MTRSYGLLAISTMVAGLLLSACTNDPSYPTAAGLAAGTSGLSANAWGPETPPFNFEAILRNDEGGFGLVKVRQPNDADLVFHLDTWVRDLAPNTSYRLQRAVDRDVNDDCTGTAWLTLGQGPTPQAIVTDDRGTGRAALWRAVTNPIGTKFDVHFRVIEDATSAIVLESACYQFVITQ
jgi:hypothetical protein